MPRLLLLLIVAGTIRPRHVPVKSACFKLTHQLGLSKLDSAAESVYFRQSMIIRISRAFHILVALALFGCALSPFIETAMHWNGNIFQTGYDTESTVAVLVLLLELAYWIAKTFVVLLGPVLERFSLVRLVRLTLPALDFAAVLPEIPPPLPLRI